jgi:predicted NAD-dependent protein-ADP-ribosyltransferase YbiA (DUF1768 family)
VYMAATGAADDKRLTRAKLYSTNQDQRSDKEVRKQVAKDSLPLEVAQIGEYTTHELDGFTTSDLRGRFRVQMKFSAAMDTPRHELIRALAAKQPGMRTKRAGRRNSTAARDSWQAARFQSPEDVNARLTHHT